MSPEAMETLSQLLLDLYTVCDTLPFPEFQREALRLVRTRLPFDSAIWVAGVPGPRGEPVLFSIHVFNLPEEMLAGYERVKDHDQLAVQALAQIGTTVNLSLSDVAWEEGSEAMRAHAQRYGMQHTLVTMTFGPVTGLISSIALYRANPEKAYSEQERLLKQNLDAASDRAVQPQSPPASGGGNVSGPGKEAPRRRAGRPERCVV